MVPLEEPKKPPHPEVIFFLVSKILRLTNVDGIVLDEHPLVLSMTRTTELYGQRLRSTGDEFPFLNERVFWTDVLLIQVLVILTTTRELNNVVFLKNWIHLDIILNSF